MRARGRICVSSDRAGNCAIAVVVALISLALCAFLAVQRMPVGIYPEGGQTSSYMARPYGGMDPAQMEGCLALLLRVFTPSISPESMASRARA